MTVSYNDIIFAYSFDRFFTSGGNQYMWDFGPNEFHMRFGAGAAAPTVTLTGELSFDGGDYLYWDGDLTRYYAKMPTGALTAVLAFASGGSTHYIYSCWDSGAGGTQDGILLLRAGSGLSSSIQLYPMQGDATIPYVVDLVAGAVPEPRQNVLCMTVETTPRMLCNNKLWVMGWAVGGMGTTSFNTAIVPRIGMNPNGGGPYIGTMSYLSFIRGAINSPDMASLSTQLANGSKPWCVRR